MANDDRDDKMQLEGVVVSSNKGVFCVKVNEDHYINCRLSGKIRVNEIKVLVGDNVIAECSPYDMCNGRIVKRHKL